MAVNKIKVFTGTSVQVLNVIRNNATQNYHDFVPFAQPDGDSIRSIGAVILQYPEIANEFLNNLVNLIGYQIITSKYYSNPWAVLKKGYIEDTQTIEDIFLNISEGYQYDPHEDENDSPFKQHKPDVRAAFYPMNFMKYYPVTVNEDMLRAAFKSWQGVNDLISKITEAIYTSANYDDFLIMKYMLAYHIYTGHIKPVTVAAITDAASVRSNVKVIKGMSNKFTYESPDYNMSGVHKFAERNEQYLITTAIFDAEVDIDVLAMAFNMDKAEFVGHRIQVDGFGDLNMPRVKALIGDYENFIDFTADDLAALNAIPAVLLDRDFIQVWDNKERMTNIFNPKKLYWNYFYHVWRTYAVSPFANAVVFLPVVPEITAISISPAAATVAPNNAITLTASVTASAFADTAVEWSIEGNNSDDTTIYNGVLTVAADEDAREITVTATCVADTHITATATITIAQPSSGRDPVVGRAVVGEAII